MVGLAVRAEDGKDVGAAHRTAPAREGRLGEALRGFIDATVPGTTICSYPASHGCVRMRIPDVISLYAHTPVGTPVYVAKAEDAWLEDVDGNRYLDMMCAYGPNLFGYANPQIDAAYVRERVGALASGELIATTTLAMILEENGQLYEHATLSEVVADVEPVPLHRARVQVGREQCADDQTTSLWPPSGCGPAIRVGTPTRWAAR